MTPAQKKFELVRILVDDLADNEEGMTNVEVELLLVGIKDLCCEVAIEATMHNTISINDWYTTTDQAVS